GPPPPAARDPPTSPAGLRRARPVGRPRVRGGIAPRPAQREPAGAAAVRPPAAVHPPRGAGRGGPPLPDAAAVCRVARRGAGLTPAVRGRTAGVNPAARVGS